MEYDCKPGNLLDLTIGSCRCTRDLSNLSSIQNLLSLNPCMQKVTDSNPSASNCTSACPSQDSFSKFRPQADLIVAPTESKNTMMMKLTHDISCLVQPATSAWNPARSFGSILETFLASQARALPVALLIGHIFNNSKNTKNISQIKFYLAATARWKTLTMTMVVTRL